MTAIGTKQANSTITIKAKCPRCGYDLRGTIETWAEECPLQGICTECGLDFIWAELLSKTVRKPNWCVEFFSNYQNHVIRSVKTLFVTFAPWMFWGSLKMSHEIHWRAIAAYLCILATSLYFLLGLCNGIVVFGLTSPNGMYPIAATVQQLPIGSPAPDPWMDIVSSTLLPLSSRHLDNVPFSPFGILTWHFGPLFQTMVMLLLSNVLCGAGFLALPVSRRIAKVRWSHVYRIIAYETAFVYPIVVLGMLGLAIEEFYTTILDLLSSTMLLLSGIVILLFSPIQIIWWSVASKRYLRMQHAWGVGFAVVIMSALAIWTVSLIYYNLTFKIG